ncbi:MAG: hypothetical protein Q9175_007136 [Cornicularia normoerica]
MLQTSLVHGAVIPQPLSTVTTNATLGGNPAYCSNNEGWVGNGIIRSDCAEAISEFYRTNVEPRKGQDFEFLTRGVRSISHLPTVITPRKGDYGTCVLVIAMLDTFWPGTLPGVEPQRYARSDIATFDEIYHVATSLSSQCVRRKLEPEAGWSFTGARSSIGVFILRRGSDLDKVLRSSPLMITSTNRETLPIGLNQLSQTLE